MRGGIVSAEVALSDYGVVLGPDRAVDAAATEALRRDKRAERGPAPKFDMSPYVRGLLEAAE